MINSKYNAPDVRERIMAAARDLFIEKGYKGTSIRDIAALSETNVAMVNYYFKSKHNLFEIVFGEAFEILIERIFSVLNSDLPFFELLEQWVDSYYETLTEYPQIPIFILNEINQNPDKLIDRVSSQLASGVYRKIKLRVKQEIAKGTIREIPTLDLMLNIISLCVFPFVFKSLAIHVAGKTHDEYNAVLIEHKKYVVEFVARAIQPDVSHLKQ